jgi:hypothetical protein
MKSAIITAGLVFVLPFFLQQTGRAFAAGGVLQFQSGFENDVRIDGKWIRGIDFSTPEGMNNWDSLSSYLPWVVDAYTYFQGGSQEIIQDPKDPDNMVLHFHNISAEGNVSRTQWELFQVIRWTDPGGPNLFDKQFYRYRLLIPPDIQNVIGYEERAPWYMIWEAHAWESEDTRHGLYITKQRNSDHWYFQAVQERPEGYKNVLWENTENQEVAVPFDEWFTFEVFFKYHETEGEFHVAITTEENGRQTVSDFIGTTKFDTKLKDQMMFKMYHSSQYFDLLPGGVHHYYDDFEIWSDYPGEVSNYPKQRRISAAPSGISLAYDNSTIRYGIPVSGRVQLNIYNCKGELVQNVLDAKVPAGRYEFDLTRSKSLSHGLYIIHLSSGKEVKTAKAFLLR